MVVTLFLESEDQKEIGAYKRIHFIGDSSPIPMVTSEPSFIKCIVVGLLDTKVMIIPLRKIRMHLKRKFRPFESKYIRLFRSIGGWLLSGILFHRLTLSLKSKRSWDKICRIEPIY